MNEIREEIVAKIEAKRVAVAKQGSKPKNLLSQRETYLASIEEHKAKIAKLEELVAKIDSSAGGYEEQVSLRKSEVEHMEEILDRFDRATAEIKQCNATITRRIEEIPDWFPGMDESLRGLHNTDPEILAAKARREYLEDAVASCLPDIKRVFYSRGTVSDFNVKGRKDV